jgi:putative transposase
VAPDDTLVYHVGLDPYMPQKNVRKPYVENGYYHIYNRGVNKELIFHDESDYRMFLFFVKLYLIPPEDALEQLANHHFPHPRHLENFSQQLTVVAFCLMPNHLHFLLHQTESRTIVGFMHALTTRYSMYFNKKYERVGPVFQGNYKGILVDRDEYLLHLSRYIHRNPEKYMTYQFSSYSWYLRNFKNDWFDPTSVLNFFSQRSIYIPKNSASYQSFVSNYDKGCSENLKPLLLEA